MQENVKSRGGRPPGIKGQRIAKPRDKIGTKVISLRLPVALIRECSDEAARQAISRNKVIELAIAERIRQLRHHRLHGRPAIPAGPVDGPDGGVSGNVDLLD